MWARTLCNMVDHDPHRPASSHESAQRGHNLYSELSRHCHGLHLSLTLSLIVAWGANRITMLHNAIDAS